MNTRGKMSSQKVCRLGDSSRGSAARAGNGPTELQRNSGCFPLLLVEVPVSTAQDVAVLVS